MDASILVALFSAATAITASVVSFFATRSNNKKDLEIADAQRDSKEQEYMSDMRKQFYEEQREMRKELLEDIRHVRDEMVKWRDRSMQLEDLVRVWQGKANDLETENQLLRKQVEELSAKLDKFSERESLRGSATAELEGGE